jgi:hypothetical protein
MYARLTNFVETKIAVVGGLVSALVVALWLLAQFVPPLQEFLVSDALFNVIAIVLLFEILRRVVELKLEGRAAGISVATAQDDAWVDIQRYVQRRRPSTVDMIEYSGGTVIALLEELCGANPRVRIRVLMCHPESALSGFERRRIEVNLEYLAAKMSDHTGITVRCYRAPASIRGRFFDGDLVTVGWYTYHQRRGRPELQGHLNAMVTGSVSTPEGAKLHVTFARAFEDLWTDPRSVDGTEVDLPIG